MLRSMRPTPLNDILEPHHVTLDVGIGILYGVADPRLRGQVDHHPKSTFFKQAAHASLVSQLHLLKLKIRVLVEGFQPVIFERYIVVVVEIIHPNHRATLLQ